MDHTTLFKFYQRLEQDDTARKLFQELAAKFAEACGTSFKKQRTDSFFIHGWLKILSRYGLLKETIRLFLQNLRKQKPGLYDNIKKELSREYLEKEFDLTEKDREKAQRQIKLMAKDMHLLIKAFTDHHQVKHYQSFKTLVTVFSQQIEVVEGKESEEAEIIVREKPEGEDIISSPHNTDSRYTKKRNQKVVGHRGFTTETCDESNQTQFITDTGLTPAYAQRAGRPANAPDVKELPEIQERLEESRMKPDKQYTDASFVNGQTILDSQENGISLEGPSSGRSQSFEAFNSEDRSLDIADFNFSIDENSKELVVDSCPDNQKPTGSCRSRNEKTGVILVHFDPLICLECPFKDRCPAKIGKRASTVTFNKASYTGAIRHHKYMGDKDYRKECGIRAGAEAMVSELVRAHGVRKSRHRVGSRIELQLIFAAIACPMGIPG
ncbi:transposase [bacterium]|nr:transposase [bacterium]